MVALGGIPAGKAAAEPLYLSEWIFRVDFPEGYAYTGGDLEKRFSFSSGNGGTVDLVAYDPGVYENPEALADDIRARLKNRGDMSTFEYRGKKAVFFTLDFSGSVPLNGWGLCVELDGEQGKPRPLLAALAYGPAARPELQIYHLSALDSIAPTQGDFYAPGPVTEFSYPRGEPVRLSLAGTGLSAVFRAGEAEAAQALVDREFSVLTGYADSPLWKEAWTRFYRAIYRDSYDRLADAAFILERSWNREQSSPAEDPSRDLARFLLEWVQGFAYERDFMGSDFVNLITAATEGRGDCDSRAMLWAILLQHGNVPAAIMVSREYSHAMGLVDLEGPGARFDLNGKKMIVAETTAVVPLGLIGASVSDPLYWVGIPLP
ncbi:hypothetical protein JFL75_10265 [Breznakiella homolactica]|uniref:Transglutaminase domain-containing protein n=1 Tax=Breznakiella homolactica TaxID=2798577 RepID=A0A7T7XRW3_9SPIR|nr:hypothetical protein JFL75_10265 [Breznakiella homolactica]